MPEEEKLFYTIGEAAQIVDVKPYVLRYWETEFRKLNPQKSVTGQRAYRKRDVRMALTIKRLLYGEKYTIAGAVKKLEELDGQDSLDPLNGSASTTPSPVFAKVPPPAGPREEDLPSIPREKVVEM
ncbi:MAG TPA: MerR family transcriptional regulator, partial [bacterium]|nr:MerR family transcriptional regulator [bacterium]